MENNSGEVGSREEGKSVEELEFERLTECFLAESGMDEFLGGLRSFHDMGASSSTVQSAMGANLNLVLGGEPSSSSSAAALERESLDHDTHNKRPKVHSFSL